MCSWQRIKNMLLVVSMFRLTEKNNWQIERLRGIWNADLFDAIKWWKSISNPFLTCRLDFVSLILVCIFCIQNKRSFKTNISFFFAVVCILGTLFYVVFVDVCFPSLQFHKSRARETTTLYSRKTCHNNKSQMRSFVEQKIFFNYHEACLIYELHNLFWNSC